MNETDNEIELEKEGSGVVVDDKGEIVTPDREEGSGKVTHREEPLIHEEDDDSSDDTPGSDGYDDREAIRAARRQERVKRKEARKTAIQAKDRLVASLQMQVQDLSERLAKVDQRQTGTDFAKLDEELNRAVRTAEEAKQFMKSTAEAGDWAGNTDAAELFYNARRQAEHLHGVKQRVLKQPQQVLQVDNRVARNASDWMSHNRWYKHGSSETDSVIAKAVDDGMVLEGYDPRTTEYWEELDDRLSEKLPHRYGAKKVKTPNGSGGPNVGGSDKNSAANTGKKGGFFLSQSRIDAMKQAGTWEDEAARKKMIDRYKTYDKEHGVKK